MKLPANLVHLLASLALCACTTFPAVESGQAGGRSGGTVPASAYADLSWRSLGPLRGGWATTARGVPGEPNVFYFGAADGGVWKTTDAGRTWSPLFQHESVASIGALEISASDPKILYVGSGQVTTRWDVTCGNGVYRSADGGATWVHRGLKESEHIGRIWIDPRNPDVVLVAALGHLYGKNSERGVFRTEDGGASWSRVLFVDEDTGAVDLVGDPTTPDVIFAATWQARRFPWQAYFTPMVGSGSGIHRSTDGGRTWTRLAGNGLPGSSPGSSIGRIGLAVARKSGAQRIYATIAPGGDGAGGGKGAAAEEGGLYRSDDGGHAWQRVNGDKSLASDYFSMITVDPGNADILYVMGRSLRRSTDAGKSFSITRGAPGGDDYHDLWIDPDHPERQIAASDQGAVVTVNGGESWSSWYNQPTGQFYRLAADDRFPYWIYSGQQDSGTVALASRSDYGELTFREWHPVGADERDSDIPFPGNPDIVFGSGLGGRLSRWDARTGQVRVVSPWPVSSYGKRPTKVRFRSTWLTPIAISRHAPHAIYLGAQVLFRSLDEGDHWEILTEDVTGAMTGAPDCEGDVPVERATACGYGVIFSIAPSPITDGVLWLGTDNGRIEFSRDGGRSWKNVTPAGLGDWSKVAQIDASPIDPASAYAAVDRHRLDDFRPYVYVTHDFGASWRLSNAGLPESAYVNVVRQDPERPELLYAGTNQGVFLSFDDGRSWHSLQLDLPTTGINDLLVHGEDLVAATQGRGIWALDDVTPLRHLEDKVLKEDAALFPPKKAWRLSPNQNRDTPLPLDEPRAENPPSGAVIDYWLARTPRGPITLEIVDRGGKIVRSFRSDEIPARPRGARYFTEDWLKPPATIPVRAGHNRFVWDLRTRRPRASDYEFSIAAVPGADTPQLPQGIFVRPGRYVVRLSVEGKTYAQTLEVASDPRVDASPEKLEEQSDFYRDVTRALEAATDASEEIEKLSGRLRDRDSDLADPRCPKGVAEAARKLFSDLEGLKGGSSEDDLGSIGGELASLATDLEGSDDAPTRPQRDLLALSDQRLQRVLARWKAIRGGPVVELDLELRKAGLSPFLP